MTVVHDTNSTLIHMNEPDPDNPGHLRAKGLKKILEERGLWEDGMLKQQAQERLRKCKDFKNEKSNG